MSRTTNATIKLNEIDTFITNGSYVIPDFQRDFVWDLEQSACLLDSWIKGYPMGAFIFWITKEKLCPIKKIGDIEIPQKNTEQTTYLLDGQQRITSIYAAIKGLQIKKKNYKDIVVNLDVELSSDSEDIVFVRDDKTEVQCIPFCELYKFNIIELMRHYQDEQIISKIQALHDKLLEFDFSAIKIENSDIEVATEIFTRLNTGGKKLSPFEIMTAKTYTDFFNLAEKTNELKESLDDDYRGNFNDSDILKIISLCVKGDFSNKTQLSLTRPEMFKNFDKVKEAILKAISFCKTDVKIPIGKVFPYMPILYLYAYFFFHYNKKNNLQSPSKIQADYLIDYYWRCVLTDHFARATSPTAAKDVKDVFNVILEGKKPAQKPISLSVDGFIDNGDFDKNRSYIKGLIGLLMSLSPKSLKKNSLVSFDAKWAAKAERNNYHHFFPQKMNGKEWKNAPVNNICNIILADASTNQIDIGTKPPSVYIAEFQITNKDLSNTLKTHLIHDIIAFGISNDDFEVFIRKRASSMIEEIKERLVLCNEDKITSEAN